MELIGREAERYFFLGDSDRLSENEKEQYKAVIALQNGKYSMDENVLTSSLRLLSHLLFQHYGEKTVILIDEYDVPLDKAFQNGYYQEMVSLIRGLFGMALKTNDSLQFAVLTGCLRISKESIFTGLNNFKVLSILDSRFDEQFGFTDDESSNFNKMDGFTIRANFDTQAKEYAKDNHIAIEYLDGNKDMPIIITLVAVGIVVAGIIVAVTVVMAKKKKMTAEFHKN